MPELIAGLLVGFYVATRYELDPQGSLVVGAVAAVLVYLASCWVWPYRTCRICGGNDKAGDGRGNYRRKRACWWCKGARDNPRIGAMLTGRARRGD